MSLIDKYSSNVSTEELTYSEEGFWGGLAGWFTGIALAPTPFGAAGGIVVKQQIVKTQNEIEVVAKRIADLRNGEFEEAKRRGTKLPKTKPLTGEEVLSSAALGLFFTPIYGAIQGSKLENESKKLKELMDELRTELNKAGIHSEEDYD